MPRRSSHLGDSAGGATLSACGAYRYYLWRQWDATLPTALFVMLNPSTADERRDDPTIRRCVAFARALDCGRLEVVNLYALRATDPRKLWRHPSPIGWENHDHIQCAVDEAARIIVAWGANARDLGRVGAVVAQMPRKRVECLGVTSKGHPRHPLMLPRHAKPEPWSLARLKGGGE